MPDDVVNKKMRGQFFTVNDKVQQLMKDLISVDYDDVRWRGLEPSAGAGDLMKSIVDDLPSANIVGCEIDQNVKPLSDDLNIVYEDFFSFADRELFESKGVGAFHTIIGNPPYVAWKNVGADTKDSAKFIKDRYSDKANLYYLFVDRCIDLLLPGGEMIFVQPKEWMYSTSAKPLREKICETGRITHVIDGGEEKVFPDADVPAIIIFRFQKNGMNGLRIDYGKNDEHNIFSDNNDVVYGFDPEANVEGDHSVLWKNGFLNVDKEWKKKEIVSTDSGHWVVLDGKQALKMAEDKWKTLGKYFSVRVGMVTGADKVFNVTKHDDVDAFIREGTAKRFVTTKGVEMYLDVNDYQVFDDVPEKTSEYLLLHKDVLLERRIIRFHEGNWWKYGAVRNKRLMESGADRIYTFAKTRSTSPFFTIPDTEYFGGGLLALFVKEESVYANANVDVNKIVSYLNSDVFRDVCESFGLTTANKVSFQPLTLEAVPFPPPEYFV